MRISPENMQKNLHKLFVTYGFTHDKAKLLATIFTESTLDGVSSHGINRVPRFIEHITKGVIQTNAEAEKIKLNNAPPSIPKVKIPEYCTLLYLYINIYPGTTSKAIDNPTICALAMALINKEKNILAPPLSTVSA